MDRMQPRDHAQIKIQLGTDEAAIGWTAPRHDQQSQQGPRDHRLSRLQARTVVPGGFFEVAAQFLQQFADIQDGHTFAGHRGAQ